MHSDVIAVIDPARQPVVSIYESPTARSTRRFSWAPRPRPPVLADIVDRERGSGNPAATGFLNCQNVRFTRKIKADWQQVRAIRVLAALALTTRSSHSHIVHAGHETVELGTVPIAPDGSFYVEVPADMPLALQAVDAEGRSELNEMSWIYVRPGERRSCLGCHRGPDARRRRWTCRLSQALRARPLKLLGQGQAHRFRGNNSGVTGMMDLQFERFRETASLNLHTGSAGRWRPASRRSPRRSSSSAAADEALKISAAQRLGLFRDRSAAPALAERLRDESREVRAAAALALAACGTRDSVPPLLDALADEDPVVAQAAAVALENLTGHAEPFQPFAAADERKPQADAWRAWFQANSWDAIEAVADPADRRAPTGRAAARASSPSGTSAATRAARRSAQFVTIREGQEPLPGVRSTTTAPTASHISADSPLNPRTLQEAVRALGHLQRRGGRAAAARASWPRTSSRRPAICTWPRRPSRPWAGSARPKPRPL